MESYLQMINRLPLDKAGKLEFVKNHIKTLKKYEQEKIDNKKKFENVLLDIEALGIVFQHQENIVLMMMKPVKIDSYC